MASSERTGGKRRVLGAALAGSTLEWYDFFIYGTAAALVFPELFFPSMSDSAGTIASFATFTVAFIVRPIGAAAFGHFGDRFGRKRVLMWTLLGMGIATCAIGALPTYERVGLLAPLMLTLLRVLQGFAVGGEWSGSVVLAMEHARPNQRGLFASAPQAGVPLATMLAAGVFALVTLLPRDDLVSWGWRIPFLLSALLIPVGFYLRRHVEETPVFQKVAESATGEPELPIKKVLRDHWRNLLLAVGSRFGVDVSFYIIFVWSIGYGSDELGLSENRLLNILTVTSALAIITVPLFGRLGDKAGLRRTYAWGLAAKALISVPFFLLLESGQWPLVWLAFVLAYGIIDSWTWGPYAAFVAELFDARTRYTGAGLSFQLEGIVGGGLTPLICASLFALTGTATLVAVYWSFACVLSLACTLCVRKFHTDEEIMDTADRPGHPTAGRDTHIS